MKTSLHKSLRYWMRLLLFTAGLMTAGLTLAVTGFTWHAANDYLHPARRPRAAENTPARLGVDYQAIELLAFDGIRMAAWYTPPRNGAVILLAHGYAANRGDVTDIYACLARRGFGVLAWDFRAHGVSGGEISTIGYYETQDVEAALDFALSQPGVQQVAAWGGSMGGAVSLMAGAQRTEIQAIVADSSFTSLEDEMAVMVKLPLLRPLIRFFAETEAGANISAVSPVEKIAQISPRPVMIIAGENDQSIPAQSGQRLYAAAQEPRTLWVVPEVGHMGGFWRFPQQYEQRVIQFYRNALSIPPQ